MAERGNKFARAVCDVLGIDPSLVRGITIKADARDVLSIEVDFIPSIDAAQQLPAICDAIKDDAKAVTLNWNRPLLDVSSVVSKAGEWEG